MNGGMALLIVGGSSLSGSNPTPAALSNHRAEADKKTPKDKTAASRTEFPRFKQGFWKL